METMPEVLPSRWRERAEYLRQYGDLACALIGRSHPDDGDPIRLRVGQRPQEHAIHDGEDGERRAQPERQRRAMVDYLAGLGITRQQAYVNYGCVGFRAVTTPVNDVSYRPRSTGSVGFV
jgi:hypothetical protein